MKRIRSRVIVGMTGTLALTGGILAATVGPAAAATPTNIAYAAKVSGTLASVGELAKASYPGTSSVSLAKLSITGLATAGVAVDTAERASASTSLASLSLGSLGLPLLSATAVSSSCTYHSGTGLVTGSAKFVGGEITALGGLLGGTPISPKPAANTKISIAGVATITLNRQTVSGGKLTVNAVYISLLGGTETITLGTSVCNAAVL